MELELLEQINQLATRLKTTHLDYNSNESKALMDLHYRLSNLYAFALTVELNENDQKYSEAAKHLNQAITLIDEGGTKVSKIENIISIVNKGIELTAKAVGYIL